MSKMDNWITGTGDTSSPASPYYVNPLSKESQTIEEGLSKCPMCCEFFDPEGIIKDGEIILNPIVEFGIEPLYWEDELCNHCKTDAT